MSATGVACPRCGAMASAGQKFCMECGCALSADQEAKTQLMGTVASQQVSRDSSAQITASVLPFKRLAPLVPLSELDVSPLHDEPEPQALRMSNGVRTTSAGSGRQPIQLTPLTAAPMPSGNVSETVVYEDGSEAVEEKGAPRSEIRSVRVVPLVEVDGQNLANPHAVPTAAVERAGVADSEAPRPTNLPDIPSEDDPDDPDSPTVSFDDEPSAVLVRCSTRETYELELPAVIGKGTKAKVIIAGNRHISRTHARIAQSDEGYTVEDLESANGTYVNERRLAQGATGQLLPGDVLRLANEEFEFLVV